MAKRKYLILFRNRRTKGQPGPSPAQLRQMFAAYKAWMEKFRDDIVDMGDKLQAGGRVVTASGVAEGPFAEAKEVISGYMIVSAEDYDGALEVVRACPAVHDPGASLEVREMSSSEM